MDSLSVIDKVVEGGVFLGTSTLQLQMCSWVEELSLCVDPTDSLCVSQFGAQKASEEFPLVN